jgi:peptide/nickel transport system substrate-binding protein
VTGVDIIDDHTVKLILSAPSASLLAQLTDRAGMIASPKAAQAAGENFGAHPVCAGPFKFVERVAQDRIVLGRFADYWDKDSIKIDRIVYLPIPDTTANCGWYCTTRCAMRSFQWLRSAHSNSASCCRERC